MTASTDIRAKAQAAALEQRYRIASLPNALPIIPITLHDYDLIIINTSGGKDSLAAIWEIDRIAAMQGYPKSKIVLSHQDLGKSEWKGTTELVKEHAQLFGYELEISKRKRDGKYDESLLEYAERRGKWPSNKQRWCTSDFKRGPGARVVTMLTKDMKQSKVLHVFGFRAEESPARNKKEVFTVNDKLTTKKRTVHDFLPIHDWNVQRVWDVIKGNKLPYHHAYDLGMPRLSCCFCIFAPFDALVIAGKHNPELLEDYVAVEKKIGHTFKAKESLAEVKQAIEKGRPMKHDLATEWNM